MSRAARPVSLQRRLMLSVTGAVALLWLLTAWVTYNETRHELEELLDAHLAQVAGLLVSQAGHGEADAHDLDAAEAERPEYRYLPTSFRQRALILPQGAVILHQPEIPVPLLVHFPFPAWATKREEVLEDNSAEALRREFFR